MTIKLIGNLMLDEYEKDNYKVTISFKRVTGEVLSILLESNFMDIPMLQVFYGKVAKDLYFELMSDKLNKKLGIESTLKLDEFLGLGSGFVSNERNC